MIRTHRPHIRWAPLHCGERLALILIASLSMWWCILRLAKQALS
jgi:hypothetical protein